MGEGEHVVAGEAGVDAVLLGAVGQCRRALAVLERRARHGGEDKIEGKEWRRGDGRGAHGGSYSPAEEAQASVQEEEVRALRRSLRVMSCRFDTGDVPLYGMRFR